MREAVTNNISEKLMFAWNIPVDIVSIDGNVINVKGDVTSAVVRGQEIRVRCVSDTLTKTITNNPVFDSTNDTTRIELSCLLLLQKYRQIEITRVQGVVITH